MIEKWENLSSRVEQAQTAKAIHREVTAMRTELKTVYDRLSDYDYDIVLDQPHVLDDQINRLTVSI